MQAVFSLTSTRPRPHTLYGRRFLKHRKRVELGCASQDLPLQLAIRAFRPENQREHSTITPAQHKEETGALPVPILCAGELEACPSHTLAQQLAWTHGLGSCATACYASLVLLRA